MSILIDNWKPHNVSIYGSDQRMQHVQLLVAVNEISCGVQLAIDIQIDLNRLRLQRKVQPAIFRYICTNMLTFN